MGMYGVEEEFWVGEYHFEVNFSNGYAVGLCQRDIWMARRKMLEDLARTSFTGPQRNHHVCRENAVGALCARRMCNHRYRVRGRGARLGD